MEEAFQLALDSAPFLLKGAYYTVVLSLGGMFFGLLLGFGLALMRLSRFKSVSWLARVYVSFFRGTPLLVQIVFLYTALAAQIGPDRAAADTELARFMSNRTDCTGCTSRDVATLHALNGDVESTVALLERDWAQQRGNALFILSNPFVLRFRDSPRFIAFCKKIGLAPPSESEAMSIDQIQALASGHPAERG